MIIFIIGIVISVFFILTIIWEESRESSIKLLYTNICDNIHHMNDITIISMLLSIFTIILLMSIASICVVQYEKYYTLQSFRQEAIAAQCGKYVLNESSGKVEFKFISTVKESVTK